MKNNISLLIIGCITTVFALLAIQGYFIYNTYQLKEKEITEKVKKIIDHLDDRENHEKSDFKDDTEQQYLIDYVNSKREKQKLISNFRNSEIKHFNIAKKYVENKFKNCNYEVGFSKNLTSIISIDNKKKDTLLSENIELYQSKLQLKNKKILNTSSWHTSGTSKTDTNEITTKERKYEFEVNRVYYYSINNLKQLLLSEMLGLLLASLLLVLFVILLFYISIKNLIQQKKITATQRDFINNITHEFKTPLATLNIATKTLGKNNLSAEITKNTVAIIERQNNRLQNIVNQVNFDSLLLGDENRKVDEKITLENIKNCCNDFQTAHPEIEITKDLYLPEIDCKMSKFHINTVLVNLLENAVKYGGTKISIRAKQTKNEFTITLSDNGIGVPKKEQSLIFDKYYRVQTGDIHTTKGLGLGLFYT